MVKGYLLEKTLSTQGYLLKQIVKPRLILLLVMIDILLYQVSIWSTIMHLVHIRLVPKGVIKIWMHMSKEGLN